MKTIGRLITAFVLFAVPALAENNDLTLFAGIQFPGKITLSNAVSTGSSGASQIISDPLNTGAFGLRIGHGKVFGGEHTIAYTTKFLDGNSKSIIYNSNIRLQAPLPKVKPYLTAGGGTVFSWGDGISDLGGKFAFNVGGGIKFLPKGPVGLHIDVRDYIIPRVQGQTLNVGEVSLGIVFAF
jgi:hypothetical protein